MLLRLKMIGSGKDGDAYRVNLPTYRHLHGNISNGWAVVIVPDDVHGLTPDELKHENVERTTEGDFYPSLCGDCIKKVHAHFDAKYEEHKGEFRLELA